MDLMLPPGTVRSVSLSPRLPSADGGDVLGAQVVRVVKEEEEEEEEEEVVRVVKALLEDDEARLRMRRAAQRITWTRHTWEDSVAKFLFWHRIHAAATPHVNAERRRMHAPHVNGPSRPDEGARGGGGIDPAI